MCPERPERDRVALAFEHAPVGLAVVDLEGRLLTTNAALRRLTGYDDSTLLDRTLSDLLQPHGRGPGSPVRSRAAGATAPQEERFVRADGSTGWASVSCSPLPDADGRVREHVAQFTDISQRKLAERDLAEFASTAAHDLKSPLQVVYGFASLLQQRYAGVLDEQGNEWVSMIVGGTQRMEALIDDLAAGHRRPEQVPAPAAERLGEAPASGGDNADGQTPSGVARDPQPLSRSDLEQVSLSSLGRRDLPGDFEAGDSGPIDVLLVEDSSAHARLVSTALQDAEGEEYRLRCVPDLRQAREALAGRAADCVLLDLSLPDGQGLNSLAQMRTAVPDLPVVVLTSHADEAMALAAVQQGAQDYLVKGRLSPEVLSRSVRYAIARKTLDARVAHQALHDALTGLPNRTLFFQRLDLALARAARSSERLAVLYLDLDGFKPINDRYGHEAGDEVLVEVAARLRAVIRPPDTLGRMGGDEFVVLCEGFTVDAHVESVRRRIEEAVSRPILAGGVKDNLSVSVGVVIGPGVGALDGEGLVREADLAMFRVKQANRHANV